MKTKLEPIRVCRHERAGLPELSNEMRLGSVFLVAELGQVAAGTEVGALAGYHHPANTLIQGHQAKCVAQRITEMTVVGIAP